MRLVLLLLAVGSCALSGHAAEVAPPVPAPPVLPLPVPAQRAETAYLAALAKLSATRKAELEKLGAAFEREFEAAQKRHDEAAIAALRKRIAVLIADDDPFALPGAPAVAATPTAPTAAAWPAISTEKPPSGGPLVITRARYGHGETWVDVTDYMRAQLVNGELRRFDALSIYKDGHIDPLPAVVKSLELEYTWNGRRDRLSIPEDIVFSLPPVPTLEGAVAPAPAVAPPAAGKPAGGGVVITHARYGIDDTWVDVTDYLRAQLVQGELHHYDPFDIYKFGRIDPAPHFRKSLELEYTWKGRTEHLTVRESTFFDLPPVDPPAADPAHP